MPQINILSEAELRRAVPLDIAAVNCIEDAFLRLATEQVVMPPVLSFHVPEHNGEVDVKTAYVPGVKSFAIKMSPGFFDNPKLGLPSLNGLMVLFSSETGLVEALLLDNGYLTDVRTAAAGAVAAKWLSPKDAATVGIVGTGMQARLQLKALTLVRNIKQAVIWGRDSDKAADCAVDCAQDLGIEVTSTSALDDLMGRSEIVVTTTSATEPLISAAQLRPGQHITAMGSDADYKTELSPDVLAQADRYICDRFQQCLERGELRAAVAVGTVGDHVPYAELGGVIAGAEVGRGSDQDITVCDLTGTGVQDTAIATLAREKAQALDAGIVFDN